MCGIIGYIDFHKEVVSSNVINTMLKTIKHRGPDNFGYEIEKNNDANIVLGHARLSIIDLTENGNQPMHYKHFSTVYNGEIYNYKELRQELTVLGHQFKTDSDTEVILHCFEEWGVHSVTKFIGMFAIVIYDKLKNDITIIRDRAGVKPLYYYHTDDLFIFGSELKPFLKHPSFKKEIDEESLKLYFRFGYIPAPYSIFKNCYKLEPGHFLKYDIISKKVETTTYWEAKSFYAASKSTHTYDEAKSHLKGLLKSACDYRMVSDVPVGVFLSGGYDSSLVTAMLQKDSDEKIKTFTIGFENGNNEIEYAKKVSKHLGTEHTDYICSAKDAQNIIPTLSYFYDEPFADSSAIPTILVSKLAKEQVKVVLSADGGDEVFGGYTRYLSLREKLKAINKIPSIMHGASSLVLQTALQLIPKDKVNLLHKIDGIHKSLDKNSNNQSAKMFKSMCSLPEVYLTDIFKKKAIEDYKTVFEEDYHGVHDEIELSMLIDYKMYMQNDILTKIDRATMSMSIEGREPLLDHRLLEYAATLPLDYKIHNSGGKRILKDIVHDYIPKEIMERPKAGFSVPIDYWLSNDLAYYIDEYLNQKSLSESSLFDESAVLTIVKQYKENKLHYKNLIWKLIIFQMWYKEVFN